MNAIEIISLVLNLLFGGGLFVTILTIRSLREKANAEGKTARHAAQRNEVDLVNDLQKSNDLLSDKLNELLTEIVTVKIQNSELKIGINNLTIENEQLRKEIADLSNQLANIKAVKR
jgi:acetolactate synthase regulatory subunit